MSRHYNNIFTDHWANNNERQILKQVSPRGAERYFQGCFYKHGIRNKLFYWSHDKTWCLSCLTERQVNKGIPLNG